MPYLVFFKLTYIATSAVTLMLFYRFYINDPTTYEAHKDTSNMYAMVVPCAVGALILSREKSALEIFWTFSEYLEGFAMVPQYVFCYRETDNHLALGNGWLIFLYIMALGGYRVFYAFNWMYKIYKDPAYSDPQSWVGGFIEIMFFSDFVMYQLIHLSFLRAAVLKVDDKVNEVVEMKVFRKSPEMVTDTGVVRNRRVVGKGDYEGVACKEELEDMV